MKLYDFLPTRSLRVRWTLQELDLPFEVITVNLGAGDHRRPEFLQINPAAKLPALVDGDVVLTESVAIVLYLAEKYPERGLVPADLVGKAQHYRWLLFTVTELEQPLWRIAKHSNLYPETDRLPADIELARRDFAPMARVMEHHLQDRRYVLGDRMSVADFVLAYTLDWANEVKLLGECPRLVQYMEHMYTRPKAAPRIADALARVRNP